MQRGSTVCSLSTESVLLLQNLSSDYKICPLTIEYVPYDVSEAGTMCDVRIVGALDMADEKGEDQKLLAVVHSDPRWNEIQDLKVCNGDRESPRTRDRARARARRREESR